MVDSNPISTPINITLESIVADVLEQWPETIPVFLNHQLTCVGCAMAPFETLADVACNYHLPAGQFLDEIRAAAQPGGQAGFS
ncbi:MAG: DUF1858 domain-containing protein [Chloroflexota bacterium]|nr:MAG: DUF1858 domain-containing protein [Chloroflexota bacterium]